MTRESYHTTDSRDKLILTGLTE